MADPMLAIPNYEAIRDNPEVLEARNGLATAMRRRPPEKMDSKDELFFLHTTGEHIFPTLGRTQQDVQNGVLDCEIRAPISEDGLRIVSWDEYRRDRSTADLTAMSLNQSWTEDLVRTLSLEQRLTIVRIAFARRYALLEKRYDTIVSDPKANGKVLEAQRRIEHLEESFENALLRWASARP